MLNDPLPIGGHSVTPIHTPGRSGPLASAVLDEGHCRHPERFVRKPPEAPAPPVAEWINPPNEGGCTIRPSRCSVEERPSRRPGLPPPPPVREETGKVLPEGPAHGAGRKGLARPERAGTLEADGRTPTGHSATVQSEP